MQKDIIPSALNEYALMPVYTAVTMLYDGLPQTPDRSTVKEWIEEGWLGLRLPAVPFRPKQGNMTYRISLRALKGWLQAVEEKAASLADGVVSGSAASNRKAAQDAKARIRAMKDN